MAVAVAKQFSDWVSQTQDAEQRKAEEMKAFSVQIEKLDKDFRDVSNDLQRERVAARQTQEDSKSLMRQLEELQEAIERSSFVLVLIDADADGYIFKEAYYKDKDGGRNAALDLEAAVREHLKSSHPELSSIPIMIKAFANADGLAHLLVKAKLTKSSGSLIGFATGFSQAFDASDFVLVGSGKDRADEKIKGTFQQFITNPTCRHIIFGACHDNGYVRLLERHQNTAVADRVTLLPAFETGKEFSGLGFRSMRRLETIFRGEPVLTRYSPPPAHRALNAEVVEGEGSLSQGSLWVTPYPTLPRSVVSRKPEDLPANSVYINAANQRLDSKLPSTSAEAERSWEHKVGPAQMKYCRKYHLQENTCSGYCPYSHGPLTPGEVLVYRHKVRQEVCHNGPDCRDASCFYGHHCSCTRVSCKFSAAMHRIDVSSVSVLRCA
ncbi:hypothetical protein BJY04DRAFT_184509 [Aspergillus karnatakaensis]|uniref:uncharacterized protein n=1 Tax=Aspergillus karnatakaensis TaxID=1810916 RepID=UPI003CCCE1E3